MNLWGKAQISTTKLKSNLSSLHQMIENWTKKMTVTPYCFDGSLNELVIHFPSSIEHAYLVADEDFFIFCPALSLVQDCSMNGQSIDLFM